LNDGQSWREIMIGTGCSRTLLAKIARRLKAERLADAGSSDPCPVEDIA
jgi:hypothetical protein